MGLIFPGLWFYGAYAYPYSERAQYGNNPNETIPVLCVCQKYNVCGCDENYDPSFVQDMYKNATGDGEPKLARLSDVNGTRTLVINGTLENGTTAEGGTEESESRAIKLEYWAGWWSMVGIVIVMCNL